MKLYKVTDPEFAPYGKVIQGYDTAALLEALAKTPLPEATVYEPSDASLEALPIAEQFSSNLYGGMPVQLGYCNGHNTKLNCLEYHRDSEVNLGTKDFILLLAKEDDIQDGKLDTGKVKAFYAPAGVIIEVYATTLHYAPCNSAKGQGFQVLVVLPNGTNGPKPEITNLNKEDEMLFAANKWLLAHADAPEASQGAVVALVGENLDIEPDLQ